METAPTRRETKVKNSTVLKRFVLVSHTAETLQENSDKWRQ